MGGSFDIEEAPIETTTKQTLGDFIVSAMTKPISGLAVSVDWALVGDKGTSFELKDTGVFGAAADVNIGEMLGLDFNIGVGVADKYYYGEAVKTNVLAAQVYGGFDLLQAYVEYVNQYTGTDDAKAEGTDVVNMLHFGIDFNVLEGLILNVYTGAADLEHYGDTYYVGGNIGYEIAGVTFKLNLQYDEGMYMYSVGGDVAQGAVKSLGGFSITPMVKVSF